MTVLLVVPDYASHWYPLSAVADALRARGAAVTVATGPTLAPLVAAAGHAHAELVLGPGSNGGSRPRGVTAELDAFFAATRDGMVATLRHQAERRRHDLLWQPASVAAQLDEIVGFVEPETVVVDQLAFSATAALRGLGVPFHSFLPGHPCQLPCAGELFGYPERRPPIFSPPAAELRSLKRLCADVAAEFTAAYNAATAALDPAAAPLEDAFAAGGTLGTLVNYPARLGDHSDRLPQAELLGSCVRAEPPDPAFEQLSRLPRSRPRVYVSLGSFLSARFDVLRLVADALRLLGWDAAVATGAAAPRSLGPIPRGWILAEHLPQPTALTACDAVVCHGGNNTVTEALTAGLPVLAAPFSTDQFAGAEDLRRAGLGEAFDPNRAGAAEVAALLEQLLLGGAAGRAAGIGMELRGAPGALRAAAAVTAPSRDRVPLRV